MSANRIRSPAAKKGPEPPRTAVLTVPAEVPAAKEEATSLMSFLQVNWSFIFAVGCLSMQCTVNPNPGWVWPPQLDLTGAQARMILTSTPFWACWGPMLAGIMFFRSFFRKHKLSHMEQSMMMWWWTNACFFHTHCDLLSGYYQVMPVMTDLYAAMSPAHLQPQWADARLHLDATYFLELSVEVPCALLCVCLYLARHPGRYVMETFALAVQLSGTVTYYTPPLIKREAMASWVCFFDRGFGAVWIVFPLLVLRRHFMAASHSKKD